MLTSSCFYSPQQAFSSKMGQDTRYGEKIPSFLKRAGTFKGQLRQRPTGARQAQP